MTLNKEALEKAAEATFRYEHGRAHMVPTWADETAYLKEYWRESARTTIEAYLTSPPSAHGELVERIDRVAKLWAVTVRVNGEEILCIETNCLSGVENIADHADTVRYCAQMLLSFIGPADRTPDNFAPEECAQMTYGSEAPTGGSHG